MRIDSESFSSERASLTSDFDTISLETTDSLHLTDSELSSEVRNIQQGEAKPQYKKYEMALKVLTIGVLIYADIKIFLATKDINKDLQTITKYFKTDGSFDEVKKNTIDLIKLFTIDVYNLITASRAITLDIKQSIYMGAMMSDTSNTDLIATSKEFDPESLSMDYTFMKATRDVLTQMNTVQPTSSS